MDTAHLIESVAPKTLRRAGRRERGILSKLGAAIEVDAGHVFMRQGEVGRDCALIVSGEVEVVIDDEVVAHVGKGEVIGEIALLSARNGYGTRTASLRAVTEAVVIVFNTREFTTLCDVCPEFGAEIARTAVRRLDEDLTAARSVRRSDRIFA